MDWHDTHIHALAFRAELFEFWLDLDYIFRWAWPGEAFGFWVAPATLVFTNVYNLRIEIDSLDGDLSLQSISRSELGPTRNAESLTKHTESVWTLDCREGEIAFRPITSFCRSIWGWTPTTTCATPTR